MSSPSSNAPSSSSSPATSASACAVTWRTPPITSPAPVARELAASAAAAAARLRDGADLKRSPFFQAFMRAQLGALIAEEEQHQREEPRLIMTPAEAIRAQQTARERQRMR